MKCQLSTLQQPRQSYTEHRQAAKELEFRSGTLHAELLSTPGVELVWNMEAGMVIPECIVHELKFQL